MDGQQLIDLNLHKSLQPNSAITKHGSLTGAYYVAPINQITDISKITFNVQLNLENPFL